MKALHSPVARVGSSPATPTVTLPNLVLVS